MGAFLSMHALRRMEARGISRDELQWVLAHPDVTYLSEDGPEKTVILGATEAGRRLKVVVQTTDSNYVVTVAARDEEA